MNALSVETIEKWSDLVGTERHRPLGALTRVDIQRFARAIGVDGLHVDPVVARRAGYPDVVAPPTMLSSFRRWDGGPPARELRRDGLPVDRGILPLSDDLIVMGGGQTLEFHHPVLPGERFAVHERLASVDSKSSRLGTLAVITTESRFLGADGRMHVRKVERTLVAGPQEGVVDAGPAPRTERSGAWSSFAENPQSIDSGSLAPGTKLRQFTVRPSTLQLFRFSSAVALEHRIHYDQDYARSEGHRTVLVHQTLHAAFLVNLVQHSFGPASRLVSIDWRNRRRAYAGQELRCRGRVVSVDGRRVICSLQEVDADDALVVEGSATIDLGPPG